MAEKRPTLYEQIVALRVEFENFHKDMSEWKTETKEWMESADDLIERNRCLDETLQGAIIALGQDRLFRQELARRMSGWRQRVNTISAAILGGLATAGAIWGYIEYWVQ